MLAGCGGNPTDVKRTMTASQSAVPVGDTPADEEPEPDPPPAAGCDLTGSHPTYVLVRDENGKIFTDWAGQPLPRTGTAGYYVTVYDAHGNVGQLGVKYLDGKQIGYFIADLGGGQSQVNVDDQVVWDADSMTAGFPKSMGFLAGGEIVGWSATYTLDGLDVAKCPDSAGATLSFPDSRGS